MPTPGQQWQGQPNYAIQTQPPSNIVQPNGTSPVVAAIVSFILPGVGQMMAGQTMKGLVILGVSVFTGCLAGLVNIGAAIDAYIIAQKLERGERVGDFDFF